MSDAPTLRVKPADGRLVRWPDTKAPLDPAGATVPDDGYWRRKLNAGDVVTIASATKPQKKD